MMDRHPSISKLRTAIASLCDDTAAPVKFYTAVGTPLDYYHGVDAVFAQGPVVVTIDASLREKPAQKADVLVKVTLTDEGRVFIDPQEIALAAQNIASLINERRSKLGH